MYAQYNQLRDLSMREFAPRMYLPPSALIDPATKRVIPSLVIYRAGVSRFAGYADLIAREGDSLVVRLASDTI